MGYKGAGGAGSYLSVAPSVCRISCAMITLLGRVMSATANACTTPTSPFCSPTECGARCVNEGSWYCTNTRIFGGTRPGGWELRRAYNRSLRLHHIVDSTLAPDAS